MMLSKLPKLIVVLGPTAVGKSNIAVQIALALKAWGQKAEIISADSRQIYTGLNIGAGKITKKEMQGVPHHCLDILSPKRKKLFSVAEFQIHAFRVIDDTLKRGAVPILCGGTGFYIDAIVDGIVLPEVKTDMELRKKLETYSTEKLVKILEKLDADRLAEIDQQNRVRIIRSIEIAKALGKVPKLVKHAKYDTLQIGLDIPKEDLMNKVHTRAIKRLKQGMVAEAKNLHNDGVS
ncbi:MAG: tRNA (adenosine(37)-N6)-dimethylallyltransferase MiaA, partial [Candidatus Pacebacteria bacterium]|nr:tRNA (adenosine(37)-N6)-dimethylallyltransferase MiaA [Candidatus Paceibacterota bacterium]